MSNINKLKEITFDEARSLRRTVSEGGDDYGIETIDDLWEWVGRDYDNGIDNVARDKSIDRERLIKLLTAQGVHEAKLNGNSLLVRHWFDSVLIVGLIVLLLLVLRALGLFFWLPQPLGLQDVVLVATRDLEAGQVLQPVDVRSTRLALNGTYFTATNQVEGFLLNRDVQAGKPLRGEDVLRLQVVAAEDIPADTLIASEALSLTWSMYQSDALIQSEQAIGKQTRYAFPKGTVIVAEATRSAPMEAQVVVSVREGLPAFHVIRASDVLLTNTPKVSGAFTSIDDVIGCYTLQDIPSGQILHTDQISSAQISPNELAGRSVLSLPISSNSLPQALTPPTRVSLLLSPRSETEDNNLPQVVENVLVLAVERHDTTTTISFAATANDLDILGRWVGTAEIFILQPTLEFN